MKNYLYAGENIDLAAPYAVSAGGGALIGTLFGVAVNDAANGAAVTLVTRGCFELAKTASQAWTVGAKIYWDNTNKVATNVSTSNTFIGHAIEAVGSGAGETLGKVRLHGAST